MRHTKKKQGFSAPLILFVSFLKSECTVFKNNFLPPVDRRMGLQTFSSEKIAFGVSHDTVMTACSH
jgi:hypothetical protein